MRVSGKLWRKNCVYLEEGGRGGGRGRESEEEGREGGRKGGRERGRKEKTCWMSQIDLPDWSQLHNMQSVVLSLTRCSSWPMRMVAMTVICLSAV